MQVKAFLAAGVLSLSFLGAGPAHALSIVDFGNMNDDDDATFVTLLVEGAAKSLRAQGKPDLAQRAIDFFKDSSKAGGLNQLIINLRTMNATNSRNAINPNNRVPALQVEDAMALTLRDKDIVVPASYLKALGKDFQPVGPRRQHPSGQ